VELALAFAGSFLAGFFGAAVGLVLGSLRLPAILVAAGSAPAAAGTNIAISAVAAATGAIEHARAGRVNAFGGSNWTTARVAAANEYARQHGRRAFAVLSNQFSLARMIAPTYEGTVGANDRAFRSWLASHSITNFAWSSQASGFFAGLEPDGFLAHAWFDDDNLERRRRATELASSIGVDPVTVALAWVLHTDLPVVPIIGPRSLAELRTSLQALDVELTNDQVAWLDLES
jgi:aryl-alcohol dehydrogenase-like predicted oxidoreductase